MAVPSWGDSSKSTMCKRQGRVYLTLLYKRLSNLRPRPNLESSYRYHKPVPLEGNACKEVVAFMDGQVVEGLYNCGQCQRLEPKLKGKKWRKGRVETT